MTTEQDRQLMRQMAARIDDLSEIAERAIEVATVCQAEARAWQEAHENKSARLFDMADEIHDLVQAMRWASATRHVVLWLAGAIAAFTAAWHSLGHFFRNPNGG